MGAPQVQSALPCPICGIPMVLVFIEPRVASFTELSRNALSAFASFDLHSSRRRMGSVVQYGLWNSLGQSLVSLAVYVTLIDKPGVATNLLYPVSANCPYILMCRRPARKKAGRDVRPLISRLKSTPGLARRPAWTNTTANLAPPRFS